MSSKCVVTLTNNLRDANAEEYAVLGSCSVLASQTVLKHLTTVIIENDVIIFLFYFFRQIYFLSLTISYTSGSKVILFIYLGDSFKV